MSADISDNEKEEPTYTGQSCRVSVIEACANVFSGMVIAFIVSQIAHLCEPQIQKYIWSGFEWKLSIGSNAIMTVVLTMISIVRGYMWRRHFNKILLRGMK